MVDYRVRKQYGEFCHVFGRVLSLDLQSVRHIKSNYRYNALAPQQTFSEKLHGENCVASLNCLALWGLRIMTGMPQSNIDIEINV